MTRSFVSLQSAIKAAKRAEERYKGSETRYMIHFIHVFISCQSDSKKPVEYSAVCNRWNLTKKSRPPYLSSENSADSDRHFSLYRNFRRQVCKQHTLKLDTVALPYLEYREKHSTAVLPVSSDAGKLGGGEKRVFSLTS